MRHSIVRFWILALLAVSLVLLSGCAAKSPEEQVAELRSGYEATLNGFVVLQDPVVEEVPSEDEVVEETADAGEAVTEDGDEVAEPEPVPVPVKQRVKLDILLHNSSYDKLPGITLDVSQGSNAGEKNHWRIWVDTSELTKGTRKAIVHILEDVDHVEGDGYAVEVRHPVPVEERGEYQEFAS